MTAIATCGVRCVGCARPRALGRMSSSPIVYRIRDEALMQAIVTAKKEAMTPRSTIQAMLLSPFWSARSLIGALLCVSASGVPKPTTIV